MESIHILRTLFVQDIFNDCDFLWVPVQTSGSSVPMYFLIYLRSSILERLVLYKYDK